MGLRKLFKKITRPISKVLDKIVPNEIKPALPYLAAFAPMMMPTTGFMGSMMGRALLSGGANAAAQLAQEGNEGDLNYLSTLMAGGIGALSAPRASEKLRGMRYGQGTEGTQMIQTGPNSPMMVDPNPTAYLDTSANTLMQNAANTGLGALEGSAKYLNTSRDLLGKGGVKPGLNLATLKAAAPAISQGTGDLMYQEGVNAERDYQRELDEYNATEGANDVGRSLAIRSAMERAGHDEDVILETLLSLGLKNGGRVGLRFGGEPATEVDFINMREVVENVNGDQVEEQENIEVASASNRVAQLKQQIAEGVNVEESMAELFQRFKINMYNQKANGGMMNALPKGMEADYRGGGFIPIGSKERADDVPARVSKNEFVMTADAVKAAGGGSVNKGAQRMYNLMNNLEARA
tara:strand:- start:465 stop:1688 length:1224 start_codon:yes stop_codon:yes gene_type:complete